jgi:hypothetical protein
LHYFQNELAYFVTTVNYARKMFMKLTPGVVEDDACKVVEAEGGVDVRLGLQVVGVVAVAPVKLVQHRLISALESDINQCTGTTLSI